MLTSVNSNENSANLEKREREREEVRKGLPGMDPEWERRGMDIGTWALRIFV